MGIIAPHRLAPGAGCSALLNDNVMGTCLEGAPNLPVHLQGYLGNVGHLLYIWEVLKARGDDLNGQHKTDLEHSESVLSSELSSLASSDAFPVG
jgi:hypothetical protein